MHKGQVFSIGPEFSDQLAGSLARLSLREVGADKRIGTATMEMPHGRPYGASVSAMGGV